MLKPVTWVYVLTGLVVWTRGPGEPFRRTDLEGLLTDSQTDTGHRRSEDSGVENRWDLLEHGGSSLTCSFKGGRVI